LQQAGSDLHYDLKHLRVFVAVAEELNFHLAAERLGLTQPAVSRIVSDLEDRLGIQLLERTTRLGRLTDAGRFLLHEAQDIMPRVTQAATNAKLIAAGTKGILKIGFTTINGHAFVPDVVNHFRAQNPDVQVDLVYLAAPPQRDRIVTGELDGGFMEGSFHGSQIVTRLSARHRLLVLLSPDHPLAAKDVLTIEDIAEEKIILGTPDHWPTLRQFITNVFQGEGRVLKIHQELPTLTSILGFLTSDSGITIFPGFPRFATAALVSRPLMTEPAVLVETHFAWRRTNTNAALRLFRDSVKTVAARSHYLSMDN
jgi:DNA-binding transcriptional LysR family regulator